MENKNYELNNGVKFPRVAIGTTSLLEVALNYGFTFFDTA